MMASRSSRAISMPTCTPSVTANSAPPKSEPTMLRVRRVSARRTRTCSRSWDTYSTRPPVARKAGCRLKPVRMARARHRGGRRFNCDNFMPGSRWPRSEAVRELHADQVRAALVVALQHARAPGIGGIVHRGVLHEQVGVADVDGGVLAEVVLRAHGHPVAIVVRQRGGAEGVVLHRRL